MKKEFSKAWKASKQPRKQKKYLANAPLHIKKKFVSVNLSKELRKEHGRNVVVKKGDTVKIMKGKFKGKQGKVTEVKLKLSKIFVEGIQVKKQDNSKVNVKLQPSNLQIVKLNMEGKKRFKSKSVAPKEEKSEEKKLKEAEKVNKDKVKKK